MNNQSGFSKNYARDFVQLAEIAMQDLSRPSRVVLPQGWSLQQMVVSDRSVLPPVPNAQGFYAQGQPEGATQPVTVLALGITWLEFLNNYNGAGALQSDMPPAKVVGSNAPPMQIVQGFGSMYNQIRASIWSNLPNGMPFYIVGKGLGGPMAQLAALDLRSGNTGPAGQSAPSTTPTCYTFSCAPIGDINFATYFKQKVPQSYTVQAGNSGLMIDFFPTVPDGYAIAGQQQNYPASIPKPYDDPWVERSGDFYLKLMEGTPQPPDVMPVNIPNPPAGFSRGLAFTLAQICAVAYQRRQHSDVTFGGIIDPYQWKEDLTSNDTTVCSIFASPDTVVAAFPGTVTWEELATIPTNSYSVNADFIAGDGAYIPQGLLNVYTAGITSDPNSASFQTTLFARLKKWITDISAKKLYLTGHDFGGSMANLAALDLRTNQPSLTLTKVYTFGSLPTGDISFAGLFSQSLGDDSYQLARTGDFAPKMQPTRYEPLDQQVGIKGTPSNDVSTSHPITGYINLLNPSQMLRLKTNFISNKLTELGVSADESLHEGELRANEQGEIILSRSAAQSLSESAAHQKSVSDQVLAVEHVLVGADERLVVPQETGIDHVVIETLEVESGGQIRVEGPATLHIGTLQAPETLGESLHAEAANKAVFSFMGVDGSPGAQGGTGPAGPAGAPGAPGGDGGTGGSGERGGDGSNAVSATINLGYVNVETVFHVRGGNGGNGGKGGTGGQGGPSSGQAGGRGGNGGIGGPGGNGGDGSTVTVNYDKTGPQGFFVIGEYQATGGDGGPAGDGGPGGQGSPRGAAGLQGSCGPRGKDGQPGKLVLNPSSSP